MINWDTPIYRIHRARYLEELLGGRLIIPATNRWDDPWENFISAFGYCVIDAEGKQTQVFLGNSRMSTFGQCWTKVSESDAMWRIYSEIDKDRGHDTFFSPNEGVRLRTTRRKLIDAVVKGFGKENAKKWRIGDVSYLSESDLQNICARAVQSHGDKAFCDVSGHVRSLLLKRDPFKHEDEARLLYVDDEKRFEKQQSIEVPIDVNKVIEQITLDPRLVCGRDLPKREEWLRTQGFKNCIDRSELYQRKLILIAPSTKT